MVSTCAGMKRCNISVLAPHMHREEMHQHLMRVDDHISTTIHDNILEEDCGDVMEIAVRPRVPVAPTCSPMLLALVVD